MTMTDPIADMLTRIRNANSVKHESVEIPASNMKKAIAQILLDEGYIAGYEVDDTTVQGSIKVTLKYGANKEKVISGIKKISKPGLKVYAKAMRFQEFSADWESLLYPHQTELSAIRRQENLELAAKLFAMFGRR